MSKKVHSATYKPFTLSGFQQSRNDDNLFSWRWSVLDLDVYIPLTNLFYKEWSQKRERSLEKLPFHLETVDIDKGPSSRLWTTEDLCNAAEKRVSSLTKPYGFTLRFVSPTAFKESGTATSLLPAPGLVWQSLSKRLGQVAPGLADTHLMRQSWNEMLIAEYRLSTRQLEFPGYVMKGFVGNIRYIIPPDWSSQDLFRTSLLFEAAPFLGIGAKTTQGMGQIRLGSD